MRSSTACCLKARARQAWNMLAASRAMGWSAWQRRARSSLRRGRDRFAACAATVWRRRAGPSRPGRHPGASRAAWRRQELAGPLHRARHLLGDWRPDIERDVAGPAVCRRGHALSLCWQRTSTYAASLVAASVKVLEELGADPRRAMPIGVGELCAGADPPARR